jgi:hypothetical protein
VAKKVVCITEGGKAKPRERLTADALYELICRHSCCVKDQQGTCPLLMHCEAMVWELNVFYGVADETDRGFRRYSECTAARPLSGNHEGVE